MHLFNYIVHINTGTLFSTFSVHSGCFPSCLICWAHEHNYKYLVVISAPQACPRPHPFWRLSFPPEGSLTLHHWQQLAKPHLASILDLHPGVVTKGFRPLPQDAVYHLNDLEEDEENDRAPWLDNKRRQEKRNMGEEGEDEGITFNVQSSSTPDGRKERSVFKPLKASPLLSASLRASPVSSAAAVTFDTLVKSASGSTTLPASQPSLSVTTTAPSIGESFNWSDGESLFILIG